MTLTFFSNYMNHHQRPLCDALYERLGAGFCFVATEDMSEERRKMGYDDPANNRPYVIKTYDPENAQKNRELALRLANESDVVILGDAPASYIEQRLRENKITFRYNERFFKEGKWRILNPRIFLFYRKYHTAYRKKNLYMLCASAYTAPDCRLIRSYPGKTYRWGYFPPVKQYDNVEDLLELKRRSGASILWTSRFIEWKHPEDPIQVAKRLKSEGYSFELNMIGSGELEGKIKAMIEREGLTDCVHLLGTMPPEEVRRHMEKADIFLFTSDRNEGWGAVLNESMNSACAVVASREIGSAPYLIRDGENGLLYNRKRKDDLYRKVRSLLDQPERRKALQINAYETMLKKWNANIAAERLLHLIDCLQKGVDAGYADGPCSKDENC